METWMKEELLTQIKYLGERVGMFEKILDFMNIPIVILNIKDLEDNNSIVFVYCNIEAAKNLGIAVNEHNGENLKEALPGFETNFGEICKRVVDRQKYESIETVYLCNKSKMEVHFFPLSKTHILLQISNLGRYEKNIVKD